MQADPPDAPFGPHSADEPERPEAPPSTVWIASVTCGRCGWPNACRVQQGMRALRFMCQWCGQMTTGIVDPSLRRNIIF